MRDEGWRPLRDGRQPRRRGRRRLGRCALWLVTRLTRHEVGMRRDGCIGTESRHPTTIDVAREAGAAGLVTRVERMRDERRLPGGGATGVIDGERALPVWLAGHG